MSGIKDMEKTNLSQLAILKNRHERELAAVNKGHEALRAETKKVHAAEIAELKDEHDRQLGREVYRKEKVLEQMRDNLDKTRQLTDKEIRTLKANLTAAKTHELAKQSSEREIIQHEGEMSIQELNQRYNSQIKKLNEEGQRNLSDLNSNMVREFSDQKSHNNERLQELRQQFATNFRSTEEKNLRAKEQMERNFAHQRNLVNQKHTTTLATTAELQQKQINQQNTEFRKAVQQQENVFEKRWGDVLNRHNQSFTRLDSEHEKTVNTLKGRLSAEMHKMDVRSKEDFYQFQELKPQLEVFEDRVEVKVAIPEHSKEDLRLTTNGKEAIITFHRRYQDSRQDEDGRQNQVNKVESFATRIQTGHILDPKSIKAKFADGMMNFVIKKA
jgi:HSP20 family molecular chaperone IbpA